MNHLIRIPTLALVVALSIAGAAIPIHAADTTTTSTSDKEYLPWEKGSVTLGGFLTAFDTSLGFGINNAAGVTINAEQLLGLDTSLTTWAAGVMYRPGESLRHQLDFSYIAYNRKGSGTLSQDIEIDGVVYPVGSQISSVFDFDIIRGTYSYALLQDERMRIAVGLGIYAVPLKYNLDVTTVGPGGVLTRIEGADTTVPLPSLALRADFQLVPKLFLDASINAMYLEISNFKGSMVDVNLSLEYRPWQHFGFGLGYNGMSMKVEGENGNSSYPGINFVGTVDVRFSGLTAFAKYTF
jgi:hypothetical protein